MRSRALGVSLFALMAAVRAYGVESSQAPLPVTVVRSRSA